MSILVAGARMRGACADGFCGVAEKLEASAMLPMTAGVVAVLAVARGLNLYFGVG